MPHVIAPNRRPVNPAKRCPVPGCSMALSHENKIGVCRHHQHNRPYCQCANCLALPEKRLASIRDHRPHVAAIAQAARKTVLICCGSSSGGDVLQAPITMQRFPWE